MIFQELGLVISLMLCCGQDWLKPGSEWLHSWQSAAEREGEPAELIEVHLADLVQLEQDIPNYCVFN